MSDAQYRRDWRFYAAGVALLVASVFVGFVPALWLVTEGPGGVWSFVVLGFLASAWVAWGPAPVRREQ